MTILISWALLVALLFGLAASMEHGAIRRRIDGANGLVFLVAGLLGVMSLPLGFGLSWWLDGLALAWRGTLAMAVFGGLLWWALLNLLDRAAKAEKAR